MTFSNKLQKLRKDNNLSQEELSRELNVSRQAISKWELGTLPDINNLVKISQYFDCSIDFLINDNTCSLDAINIENTNLKRETIDIHLLVQGSILAISILGLLIINICSIINPAPIVKQASDGSWYVGITGFIDYYSIQGIVVLLFITAFISFSIVIFYIMKGKSKKEKVFKQQNSRILCGYLIMMLYGFLCFYEIMTSSCFYMDITVTIFTILVNTIGMGLIITGFQQKKGL